MFDLAIPAVPWVTLLDAAQWRAIGPALQADLMASQIRCGRGNVYDADWFGHADCPVNNTVTVDGRWFYLLTAEDWQAKGFDEQKLWVVKWLQEWHTEDGPSVNKQKTVLYCSANTFSRAELNGGCERVPYGLIHEYAGRFASTKNFDSPSKDENNTLFISTDATMIRSSWPCYWLNNNRRTI